MALNTFGWTPAEVTQDSAGNVVAGVTLTVFTDITKSTQVTGLFDKDGITPLANDVVVSDVKGRFGFKASDAYSLLYVYDGSTADPWPIAAHEALDAGNASHAQAVADAQAAADSAAQAASLVGAPADTIMATTVGNAASATRAALNANFAGAAFFKRKPAGGSVTTGDVVLLGSNAYAPDTIATSLVAGGAPLYENVIGGNISNIAPTTGGGTKLPNTDGAAALTGNDGNWNFILGGYDTVVNGSACIAAGYHNGIFAGSTHATIGGGSHHRIQLSDYSTIAGGTQNTITGSTATIGGGRVNTAAATSTVAGGSTNAATGATATIGGGFGHTGSGDNSTISGGYQNTSSGNAAAVGGGQSNTASGQGAAVPGGRDNKATQAYSVATGRGAQTNILGERAHASTPFVTAGDAQESTTILKRQTTDATQVALTDAGGSSSPLMAAVSTNAFVVTVVARRTDTEGDHAAWRIQGCLARHVSGSTMVGTPTVTSIGATAGAAAWAVAVTYSSGRLVVNVTGAAGQTIRWVGRMELTTVAVS